MTELRDTEKSQLIYYSINKIVFIFKSPSDCSGTVAICHFSRKNMATATVYVSITSVICIKTHLNSIMHAQIIFVYTVGIYLQVQRK